MEAGFIGLGQMGSAMAHRLLDRGHRLTVWNRSAARTQPFAARGATVAREPVELLRCELVVSMLADDAAVAAVWLERGLVRKMPAHALHLNMASMGLALGKDLAQAHAQAGSLYVAAPVFGRPEIAAKGALDIVAAGEPEALARCGPLFEALGQRTFNVGREPHHANIVKIARNFMLAAIVESLGEAFALVEKNGVKPQAFLDIVTGTSMSAPAFRNYGRMMLEPPQHPTFPLRLGLKDVELALDAGALSAVPLPSATLIRTQHLGAIANGYGDKDWAELGNWIAACAGLDRSGSPRA